MNICIFVFIFTSDYPNVPYTGYYKILNPAVNLRDADLIKDVLIKNHFNFHVNEQNFNKKFDPLMAHNPFVATNDSWRKGRSVLTPLLTLFKVNIIVFCLCFFVICFKIYFKFGLNSTEISEFESKWIWISKSIY